MIRPDLHIVGEPKPETVAERIRRLQADLLDLSAEQVAGMRAHIAESVGLAREVAMNPAQPEGVRQLAEKMVRDGDGLLLSLDAVVARSGR
jgi:hypothetical protein